MTRTKLRKLRNYHSMNEYKRKSLSIRVAAKVFGFCLAILFVPGAIAQSDIGRLKGIVVDWQFARIPRTTIEFRAASLKKVITVDAEGSYYIELPTGFYLIIARSQGFYERRINFKVNGNTVRTLNMMLDVRREKIGRCPKKVLCL